MTWYVVKRAHETKGAAFESADVARDVRDRWNDRHPDEDFEIKEAEAVSEEEVAGGEAALAVEPVARMFGL